MFTPSGVCGREETRSSYGCAKPSMSSLPSSTGSSPARARRDVTLLTRRGGPVSPRRPIQTRGPDGAAPALAQSQEESLDPLLDAAAVVTSMLDAMTRRSPAGRMGAVQSPAPELLSDEARRALLLEALQAQKSVLVAENASLAGMNAVIQRHLRS